jgi:hypothetical protein
MKQVTHIKEKQEPRQTGTLIRIAISDYFESVHQMGVEVLRTKLEFFGYRTLFYDAFRNSTHEFPDVGWVPWNVDQTAKPALDLLDFGTGMSVRPSQSKQKRGLHADRNFRHPVLDY